MSRAVSDPTAPHRRYLYACCALFAAVAIPLGVEPHDRSDWALENALAFLLVGWLLWSRKRFPLSRVSYTLIFAFLLLHEVGAHYTYSEVPYREWLPFFGGSERNHYDRFVHFCFGLLLAYPIREIFFRLARVRGFWAYYLPLDVTMACSMLYELIEWGAAIGFGGELGVAYLGTQGDQWDAQKDMALATLGAVVAMIATAGVNRALGEDIAHEWVESLRERKPRPLGEDEIQRLRAEKGTGRS